MIIFSLFIKKTLTLNLKVYFCDKLDVNLKK